ncbi:hypothetical protein VFPFJ_08682 [Purpureocillium lilacinum]|uniref:Uncharacterized protein n=1 Tax=Purpureocillium lilacinum TaxID=33203 RepID=A0A179GCB1_PURLI|nr:hypothetical protein VFPFJ_08682 [Purpureocillium lilacinum]OAQ74769.1 hypothetical protein VFPBJ_10064 [Purpureocillium lilacinum]OAQ82879.1 hypothetical protein VFPFJ_08682 [Purpureocillium lilacinum]
MYHGKRSDAKTPSGFAANGSTSRRCCSRTSVRLTTAAPLLSRIFLRNRPAQWPCWSRERRQYANLQPQHGVLRPFVQRGRTKGCGAQASASPTPRNRCVLLEDSTKN